MISLLLSLFPMVLAMDDPMGAGGTPTPSASSDKTTAEYLSDLDGDKPSDRLLAARVLQGQLRRALRTEARGKVGTLAYDDARAALVELEQRLPGACSNALAYANVVAPCAEMLAMLDVFDAIPAIEAVLATETRKGPLRRITEALAMLKEKQTAG